jgi:HEAT repeat protein
LSTHYRCWHCYGTNSDPAGGCAHCGEKIAAPPDASYDERLAWALRHPDPDRAMMAARVLGERRAESAAPHLLGVVRDPPDPYVGAEALRSLIAIQGAEALHPLLEELARKESFLLAGVARQALREMTES